MSAAERLRKSQVELRALERAFTDDLFAALQVDSDVFADDTSAREATLSAEVDAKLRRQGLEIGKLRSALGNPEPYILMERYLAYREMLASESPVNSKLVLRFLQEVDLRYRLPRAFPAVAFSGLVSTHHECDDGLALRKELWGKSWDEVPLRFVDSNSLLLNLLQPDALVAFLPAWLSRSLDMLDDRYNELVFFTVALLCPRRKRGTEELAEPPQEGFDKKQRRVIFDFLRLVRDSDAHSFNKDEERGMALWVAAR